MHPVYALEDIRIVRQPLARPFDGLLDSASIDSRGAEIGRRGGGPVPSRRKRGMVGAFALWERCESRGSRTVLREVAGEIPVAYSPGLM